MLDEDSVAVATTEEAGVWLDMECVMGPRKGGRGLERVVPDDDVFYLLGQEISHGHCLLHGAVFTLAPKGTRWGHRKAT